MGNGNFVEFSDEAPEDFKVAFMKVYSCYDICAQVSYYPFRIGFILVCLLESLGKLWDKLDPNIERTSIISSVILGLLLTTGAISSISQLFKKVQQKKIDSLFLFTKYFVVKPTVMEYDDNTMTTIPVKLTCPIDYTVVNALKFKYRL